MGPVATARFMVPRPWNGATHLKEAGAGRRLALEGGWRWNAFITENKDSNILLSLSSDMSLTNKLDLFISITAKAQVFSRFVTSQTEIIL
jgi:hypothetical protein